MKPSARKRKRPIVPRPARVKTEFIVRLSCAAGAFPARVTNLSGAGFCLRSARPVKEGWEVSLEVPRRPPVKGVIRWVIEGEAGGVFLESIAL